MISDHLNLGLPHCKSRRCRTSLLHVVLVALQFFFLRTAEGLFLVFVIFVVLVLVTLLLVIVGHHEEILAEALLLGAKKFAHILPAQLVDAVIIIVTIFTAFDTLYTPCCFNVVPCIRHQPIFLYRLF